MLAEAAKKSLFQILLSLQTERCIFRSQFSNLAIVLATYFELPGYLSVSFEGK